MTLLAAVCVAGHLWFTVTAWLLPLTSQYTLVGDNIGELAIGRFGHLQTAAFIVSGIASLALAVGVRRVTRGTRGSLAGSVLVGVSGRSLIVAAIFPTDRIDGAADLQSLTAAGAVHLIAALTGLVAAAVGMSVLSWTFRRDARWHAFWPCSMALAYAALVLLFLQAQGPHIGLLQRLLSGTIALWSILVALRLPPAARAISSLDVAAEAPHDPRRARRSRGPATADAPAQPFPGVWSVPTAGKDPSRG
jgi:hypothetical protein